MIQEEKIKEIIETILKPNQYPRGIVGLGIIEQGEEFAQEILDWHTSELNRKMEEVLKELEKRLKQRRGVSNETSIDSDVLTDLKSLLKEGGEE